MRSIYPDILGLLYTILYVLSPEVQEIPAVTEHGGNSGGEGELEVLEVDPYWPRHQLRLLRSRHKVYWELEPGLKLVAQSDLYFRQVLDFYYVELHLSGDLDRFRLDL